MIRHYCVPSDVSGLKMSQPNNYALYARPFRLAAERSGLRDEMNYMSGWLVDRYVPLTSAADLWLMMNLPEVGYTEEHPE